MPGLFDTLNAIFYKKEKYEYNKKDINGYGLSLWLSHDTGWCVMVNDINPYIFELSDDLIYKYFYHKVTKGRRNIKWVKKDDKKEKKYDELAKMYNCSIEEIKKSVIGE